jgi:hypothetical protein
LIYKAIISAVFFFVISRGIYAPDSVNNSSSLQLIRGPYLQSGTQSSIIIKWRTNEPTDSRVIYGTGPRDLNKTKLNEEETTEHEVLIEGLVQDTKYYYNIGDSESLFINSDPSCYFKTSPSQGYSESVRIWAIGDFGSGDEEAENVRRGYMKYRGNKHTDVWLALGDMAYFFGKDEEFQKSMFSGAYGYMLYNTVIWPTQGNHDMRNAASVTLSGPYYDIFSVPQNGQAGGEPSGTEAYYSFNYGDIHFVSLNSEDVPRDKHGAMADWLRKDLKHDHHKWTIAYFHHPPYTKGTHDSDMDTDSNGRMKNMRENFLPILEKGGVDLVLSGHSHIYERSWLIHGHYGYSNEFESDNIVKYKENKKRNSKSAFFKKKNNLGTVYVVCGMSGSRPSAGTCDHPAMVICRSWNRGSIAIEVKGNLLLSCFVDEYGRVKDSFTITKEYHNGSD